MPKLSQVYQALVQRFLTSGKADQTHVYPHHQSQGIGQEWTPEHYGDYMAKSVPIYTAVNIRAESMSQLPWHLHRIDRDGNCGTT
jgi:hypothetical protein